MKKTLIFLFIISILTSAVFSQEDNSSMEGTNPHDSTPAQKKDDSSKEQDKTKKEKSVSILTNPLLFFSDFFSADYYEEDPPVIYMFDLETQFKINNDTNISFSIAFLFGQNPRDAEESTYYNTIYLKDDVFQVCFKPMFIHKPFGTGIDGFFLGLYPHFTYTYVNDSDNKISHYFEVGGGMSLGYKWTFRSGLTLQTGFGLGKTFGIYNKQYKHLPIAADGRLKIGSTDLQLLEFKIGYSF